MLVGIDVHTRSHAAALVDERGAPIATLTIPNSRAGVARLCRWLSEQGADGVAVGVENAGGYGRLACAVLVAAGHEVLNVPPWRVKRERVHEGPGKSDPADTVAIAQCVLRHRDQLGPALEPPLIRAIALRETHRRQSVRRRTDAIQRLRAVWAQLDPEAESATANVASKRALRQLKEIDFGDGLAEHTAARCIRDLARENEALNARVAELERELADLLAAPGDPFADVRAAGLATTVTLIAESGDVRRFRGEAAYARYGGSAPIPCGSGATTGRTASTAAATARSTPASTASPSPKPASTRERAPSSNARWPRERRSERLAERSSAIAPTSSTDASTPGLTKPSRLWT